MLPKENRLKNTYEFNKVRYLANKNHTKINTPFVTVFYMKTLNKEEESKFGIVVSTKFSKLAVKRNKAKRIYRELIRNNFDKITPGYWVVFHPKSNCLKAKHEEISADFNKSIQEIFIAR